MHLHDYVYMSAEPLCAKTSLTCKQIHDKEIKNKYCNISWIPRNSPVDGFAPSLVYSDSICGRNKLIIFGYPLKGVNFVKHISSSSLDKSSRCRF